MCEPRTRHELCITVGFDKSITIEFPHQSWASSFCNKLSRSPYHTDKRTNPHVVGEGQRHVRLWLPQTLNRVQIKKLQVNFERYTTGPHLLFAFTDAEAAAAWLQHSPLWISTTNGAKLYIPVEWTHETFDSCFAPSVRDVAESAPVSLPPPLTTAPANKYKRTK